jgi:hypothetical protein
LVSDSLKYHGSAQLPALVCDDHPQTKEDETMSPINRRTTKPKHLNIAQLLEREEHLAEMTAQEDLYGWPAVAQSQRQINQRRPLRPEG